MEIMPRAAAAEARFRRRGSQRNNPRGRGIHAVNCNSTFTDWLDQPRATRTVFNLAADHASVEEQFASRPPVCLARRPAMPVTKKKPAAFLHPDLAEVLLTEQQIRRRVKSLAKEIKAVYGKGEFTIISLINGAVMFTADLMREI